ncbi:MAG: D-2-hydroxyacid dehydrogenase family protein [Armatimonadetes bacterium]|nr:D-2-hydroxyacid dehydrogenase family protein [Armatimonadota bacterium]
MHIAVLDDYQDVALKMADWSALGPQIAIRAFQDHLQDMDAVAARLRLFEVIVAMRERTPFPRALLEQLPALRLLVTTGMSNAAIDVDGATALGITACGTEGRKHTTAELTWGLILALVRHIPQEDRAIREGQWQMTVGTALRGKVLGILGLGTIGAQVAAVGRAFGMPVIAWSQNLTAQRAAECGATLVTRDRLFTEADVLTIHLVLSERTRGLVGAREMALMKPTACLINTSRGPIVDEAALVDALRRGIVAGAALDVFDEEPLPPDHPFRRLPNMVVTPHVGYVTAENYRLFYGQAVEDIQAFLRGDPIRVLNPAVLASERRR